MSAPAPRWYQVPGEARGERLDQHLTQAFPELSRSRIQALLAEGAITLNGSVAKRAQRLTGGETVLLELPAPRSVELVPEALDLDILYEDKDLVVLNKAAGMVVHPAPGNWEGTVVHGLLHQLRGFTGVSGELRPGIVHRLDKDTSGCLVVAKTEAALLGLQKAFKARTVEKIYLALVHGTPPSHATIATLYGRHPIHRKRFTGRVKEGKAALTEYRTLELLSGAALLEVTLHTGRTHQIRVHLSEAGFPLLGDALYGRSHPPRPGPAADAQKALGRQALHAWKLAFEHPRTRKRVALEAPLPEDFKQAVQALK